jgi:hypothetical protein
MPRKKKESKVAQRKLECSVAWRMNHLQPDPLAMHTRDNKVANTLFLVWRGPNNYYRQENMERQQEMCSCFRCLGARNLFWNQICPPQTTPTLSS